LGRLLELYRRRALREFDTLATAKDARRGYGYGRASTPTGTGGEFQSRESFPYTDGPEELDSEVEDEDPWSDEMEEDLFLKKTGAYYASRDGNRGRGNVDRASFVQGGRGLGEGQGSSTSISPFPDLYKDRECSGGTGGVAWTVYTTGPGHKGGGHGSKRGWWRPPPPMLSDVGEPAYTWQDVPDDAERSLQKAKRSHDHLVKDFSQGFDLDDDEADGDDLPGDFA